MATATVPIQSIQDPRIKEKLQELRQTDNVTNIYYFARIYVYFAVVIGGTLGFYHYQASVGWNWWWNVPVTILAITLIGAGQHQLTALAHEAAHHTLFRNRFCNDLFSDWLCMFPLYSSTQHYRLQHLAHHQFVNDPDRDPDISQLKTSGHWLNFPVTAAVFLKTLLKQLWLPNLIRFMRIRAQYNAIATDKNPYLKKGWKPNKKTVRVGILYMVGPGAHADRRWFISSNHCSSPSFPPALWLRHDGFSSRRFRTKCITKAASIRSSRCGT